MLPHHTGAANPFALPLHANSLLIEKLGNTSLQEGGKQMAGSAAHDDPCADLPGAAIVRRIPRRTASIR
jgi:hypothetical protein